MEQQEKRLREEIEGIINQIEKLKKDDPFSDPERVSDNAAIDTDAREQIGHDTIEAEIKVLKKRQSEIVLALNKMKAGKYGICDSCRKPISKERLKLLPEAKRCMTCANGR